MKQVCKYLGYSTIVLGIIGSFILAKNLGVEISLSTYAKADRNWLSTIIYFVFGLFCTAVSSSILLGISEILKRLETIRVQETSSGSLLKGIQTVVMSEQPTPKGYWKCPNCGRNNPSYTGTCGCGQNSP